MKATSAASIRQDPHRRSGTTPYAHARTVRGYLRQGWWLGCGAMPDNKADLSSPTGSASPGSGVRARRVVERLDEPECMELLSTAQIGRLVYNSRYGLVAVPSEYKIHEGSIVFRTYQTIFTEEDLRTGIAYAEYKVAVEVDQTDAKRGRDGWWSSRARPIT